jgi:hypothetical protein
MNKPRKYEGNEYVRIKELKQSGEYITLPFAHYGVKETDKQKEIRSMFSGYHFCKSNMSDMEDVIYELNERCEYEKYDFEFPYDSYADYLIEFDSGIIVHIHAIDEYHGAGHIEQWINVIGIVVPDNATNENVEEVIEWLKEVFDIKK